ncbi:TerC family protein [Paenibacillus sepulcri]|uniref:TerC family protein n=1 Tax=Paenibacillus sepulcri TaxID=359917 RepID=A0ABS7C669_9BACL|nr:TerC family protein [Paenibacillus sepulcri]
MEGNFVFVLLELILINVVLSGDNAVVIALASRNLPAEQQKKAVFWGSMGAIGLRIVLTFAAVWLLRIPFVQALGGLLLLFIAVKLLKQEEETENIQSSSRLSGAVKTIIVADLVMSLDNVLAMAGAAGGNLLLIVIGLAISIPLIIWASQLLMRLMKRFPIIVVLGAALLGYTAGEMILDDKGVSAFIESTLPWTNHLLPIVLAIAVVAVGHLINRTHNKRADAKAAR